MTGEKDAMRVVDVEIRAPGERRWKSGGHASDVDLAVKIAGDWLRRGWEVRLRWPQ